MQQLAKGHVYFLLKLTAGEKMYQLVVYLHPPEASMLLHQNLNTKLK